MHASLHIENLRNLSQTIPGESDAFQANQTYCAVGLGGPGGLIGVLKVMFCSEIRFSWIFIVHRFFVQLITNEL